MVISITSRSERFVTYISMNWKQRRIRLPETAIWQESLTIVAACSVREGGGRMNKQNLAIAVLIATVTAGFGFWRWEVAGRTHPAHGVLVWDRSESVAIGSESVVASAKQVLQSRSLGKGSTLTISATGDASSASEPIVVATYETPVNRRVLEGRSAALDRREELLDDLK